MLGGQFIFNTTYAVKWDDFLSLLYIFKSLENVRIYTKDHIFYYIVRKLVFLFKNMLVKIFVLNI